MSESIFREKSLEKVKSPDNLNEYIQVSNPGVWMLLATIVFLLVGFCLWAAFGQIQTVIRADAHCEDGIVICYLTDSDAQKIRLGMTAEINGRSAKVTQVSAREDDHSLCILTPDSPVPDGIYTAQIQVENLRPVSFLLN